MILAPARALTLERRGPECLLLIKAKAARKLLVRCVLSVPMAVIEGSTVIA